MSALLTSAEIAMAKDYDQGDPKDWKNKIPPILCEMGKHWEQPDMSLIMIDDTHAVMDQETFNALHDYSHSFPTGVYPGKCWRRSVRCLSPHEPPSWWLIWFGYSDKPDMCSSNWRKILIV